MGVSCVRIAQSIEPKLLEVGGVLLEHNKYTLSVHTRNVSADDMPKLEALLEAALEDAPLLKRTEGHHVIELRPQARSHPAAVREGMIRDIFY